MLRRITALGTAFMGWLMLDALIVWMGGGEMTPRTGPDGIPCWGGPEDGSHLTAFPGSTIRSMEGGAYYITRDEGEVYFRWCERLQKKSRGTHAE